MSGIAKKVLLFFIFPPPLTFWILKYSICLLSPAIVLIFPPFTHYLQPAWQVNRPCIFQAWATAAQSRCLLWILWPHREPNVPLELAGRLAFRLRGIIYMTVIWRYKIPNLLTVQVYLTTTTSLDRSVWINSQCVVHEVYNRPVCFTCYNSSQSRREQQQQWASINI